VVSIGIPQRISLGMEIGFEHKLQLIKSEFTELPTGVNVDVTDALAVFAVGNVPVANPRILLI
jgi:hypothetical protein